MADCIFCDIGQGETSSETLYNDDQCFVIRDIHPAAPTHLLVLPHEHVTSLASQEALVGHLFTVAHEIAYREGIASSGFRLVINQGDNAGQVLGHLHLHLLGGRRLGAMG